MTFVLPFVANTVLTGIRIYETAEAHQGVVNETNELYRVAVILENKVVDRLSMNAEGKQILRDSEGKKLLRHVQEAKDIVDHMIEFYSKKDIKTNEVVCDKDGKCKEKEQTDEDAEDDDILNEDVSSLAVGKTNILQRLKHKALPLSKLSLVRKMKDVLMFDMLLLAYNMTNSVVGDDSNEDCDEAELFSRLKENIEVKDRKYHLKTYKQCFLGKAAVDWVMDQKLAFCRTEATKTLNNFVTLGLIEHVTKDHSFEDKDLFYRFIDEEGDETKAILKEPQPEAVAAASMGPDLRAWWAAESGKHEFSILVFYRGIWDTTFCRRYLKRWASIYPAIVAKGGFLVAVSSDTQELADKAKASWNLPFPTLGEPRNQLANHTEVYLSRNKPRFPLGMANSAVYVRCKDGKVWFEWRMNPKVTNLGGGRDRPDPFDVWKRIQYSLLGKDPSFIAVHIGCPLTKVGWTSKNGECPV